ncbi:GNAT family N-acetyltransferase [Flavobacterium reichenbachii]|uniref:GCN5 family acetyltransferase n=1 Tax=Flavobacterium reichenbachii TaxID=362418 RepID=A0A085ZIN9_9FLAO|nr:GNAT family N-acetyltransferase [Flavobacterium reichenbachii]KFF04303.1 GCN5 family acetyltransferase [Flavobacterium reichenbachii]OXB11704.1 N-acetyltransferase [Flavobacterium reichenbachii]
MIIRKALLKDSKTIAVLLLTAMEEIVYSFIGTKNYELALELLLFFVERENNQYSYQNCFVTEENGKIIGAVNIYDGARFHELREPVIRYVQNKFNPDFNPEDETENGEFYIDSIGVDSGHQGKGIGSQILQFLIDDYVIKNNKVLGLLVEEGNPNAKKLYLKLGFKSVGPKKLAGKNLEHLQLKP